MRYQRKTLVGRGFAIGAFNFNNLEDLQAISRAAEDEDAPAIAMASEGVLRYAGIDAVQGMFRACVERSRVPLFLQLDHGGSFATAMTCLAAGFSGVMIDGSRLPFDENVALTRRVVEAAHAVGAWVEGELGVIGGREDDLVVAKNAELYTDPREAARFVAETGVDALAVAIGTAHGLYRERPRLDIERLREIRGLVDVDLVLHGGSDVPDDQILAAVRAGIDKVNVGTELRLAFVQGMREGLAAPDVQDHRKVLTVSRAKVADVVRAKIRLFGSSGAASLWRELSCGAGSPVGQ